MARSKSWWGGEIKKSGLTGEHGEKRRGGGRPGNCLKSKERSVWKGGTHIVTINAKQDPREGGEVYITNIWK